MKKTSVQIPPRQLDWLEDSEVLPGLSFSDKIRLAIDRAMDAWPRRKK